MYLISNTFDIELLNVLTFLKYTRMHRIEKYCYNKTLKEIKTYLPTLCNIKLNFYINYFNGQYYHTRGGGVHTEQAPILSSGTTL